MANKNKNNEGRKNKRSIISMIVAICIVAIGAFFGIDLSGYLDEWLPAGNSTEPSIEINDKDYLEVTMIDVGQGDSFLFEKNGHYAMIDFGTSESNDELNEIFDKKNIQKFDFIIGSHAHDDHLGGMKFVIDNYDVGKIILNEKNLPKNGWGLNLKSSLKKQNDKVIIPSVNDCYVLDGVNFKILGPDTYENSDENNNSVVVKVTYGEMDILMTGDMEAVMEKQMLSYGNVLDCEVLKLGHHGSKSSSCSKFLDVVSPDYALISAKLGNKYKHPSEEIVNELEKRKISVYRTDEASSVTFKVSPSKIIFETKPNDYLSGIELKGRDGK